MPAPTIKKCFNGNEEESTCGPLQLSLPLKHKAYISFHMPPTGNYQMIHD